MGVTEFADKAEITLTQASRILNGASGTRRTTLPRFVQALGLIKSEDINALYRKAGFQPPQSVPNSKSGISMFENKESYDPVDEALTEEESRRILSRFEGRPRRQRERLERVLDTILTEFPDVEYDVTTHGKKAE